MKFNENLQEIWLGSNSLITEDGQHLGNILRSNHTLRVLDLRDNNLQDSGVRYISAGVAEQGEGLLTLNLTSNSIGQDGFHHVSAMLVSSLKGQRFQGVSLLSQRVSVLMYSISLFAPHGSRFGTCEVL